MLAAPTGALPLLGHVQTQEKHLTIIGALKLRNNPNVASFSLGSAPFASLTPDISQQNRLTLIIVISC